MPELAPDAQRGSHSLQRLVTRQFDGVTIYNADWKDVLPDVVCDAIITDQPYGTGWMRGGGKKAGDFKARKETAEWDVFDLAWMEHAPETVAAFCPIQGVWEMCLRLKTPCVLKYRKSNPAPYGVDCEPVVCSRPISAPWEKEAYNGDNALHPCQKPVNLMAWLILALTEVGQTVCDPFAGSGSTAIACIRTGRKFVGCEKDAQHYATACERIDNELRQGVLLPCNDRAMPPEERRQ
jgi:hypothetical protein